MPAIETPEQQQARTMRAKQQHWTGTWNNPPDHAKDRLNELYTSGTCTYVVYQEEKGESGTPHLQLFVTFATKKRLTQVREHLPCHWVAVQRGTHLRAANYCKKDDTRVEGTQPVEHGEPPVASGTRNDITDFMNDVKEGLSLSQLHEKHFKVFASYKAFADEYFQRNTPPPTKDRGIFEPREWHEVCNEYINQPDNRTVMFVVDELGGMGKTTYANHLLDERSDVQYLKPEKEANIALLLDPSKKIFLFDCPRSRLDIPLPYNTIEGIKDGYVVSGKYQSCMKSFTVPNTVIVFTNEAPDPARFSHDRWNVYYRNPRNNKLFHCVPTETDAWDVMSDDGRHRLTQISNHDVEKRSLKRKREEQQDEIRQNSLNRSRAAR